MREVDYGAASVDRGGQRRRFATLGAKLKAGIDTGHVVVRRRGKGSIGHVNGELEQRVVVDMRMIKGARAGGNQVHFVVPCSSGW